MANYVAGLLILVGGLACLFLTQPRIRLIPGRSPVLAGKPIPRPLMLIGCLSPVLLGGVFAVAHGIAGIITQSMELCGVIHVDYPSDWVTLDVTELNLWSIFFYEPWFLAMGICLIFSALEYLRDTGSTEVTIRRMVRVFYALITVLAAMATLAVIMHWNFTVGG